MKSIKKIIERCLDEGLRYSTSFRDYVNYRYSREDRPAIDKRYLSGLYYSHDGIKFYLTDHLPTIDDVCSYKFDDIRSSDIVLDIGANIGAFALHAAKKAKHV